MSRLLVPNSWSDRISQQLIEQMPREGAYVYVGSCMTLGAEGLEEMLESDTWPEHREAPDSFIDEIRKKCAGLGVWERVLGYGEDTILLKDDWHVDYGKGTYRGLPCYWIRHSAIEYVWVENQGTVKCDICGDESNSLPFLPCGRALGKDEEGDETRPPHCVGTYLPMNLQEVQTGRMSCSKPNIANRPKCKHGNTGPCYECRMDPVEMKVVPFALTIADIEEWGCPYCGYDEGHIGINTNTGMPAAAEGTFVRYCNSCKKYCYALADGVEQSKIPFGGQDGMSEFYPHLNEHPRAGQPKHHNKVGESEREGPEVADSSIKSSE